MKKHLSNFILLCLLSAFILPAQTVIKIPFDQPPPFVVQPMEIYMSMENNDILELGLLTEIYGGSGNYSFTWTYNGFVVGYNPTLIISEKGSYTLTINDGEGCESTSVYHVDTGIGILNPAESMVQIFPNPSDGTFFIHTPKTRELKTLEVFSMNGVIRYSHIESFKSDEMRMDLGHLPKGSYLVVLQYENEKITKVLVIR